MTKAKDITGIKFNRLTAIELDHINIRNHGTEHFWKFKCDCGCIKVINKNAVMSGHIQSCGCLHKERTSKAKSKHCLSNSRIYNIWSFMKNRCFNKRSSRYKDWGGRGITIYKEWLDFNCFYDWAIVNGYSDNLTIDRIDVNGNYEPNNCRWVTPKEQARNTRKNKFFSYNGETHCISEWCEILNINYHTFFSRFLRGWDIDKIINTPVRTKKC